MMGILFYLSHNAEVPQPHQAAGLVTQTQSAEGEAFDWNEVTGGLFRVRSSTSRPANAFVVVPYRGAWFYIADNDLESKSTFCADAALQSAGRSDQNSGPGADHRGGWISC